jgi:hypothetical protein
MPCEDYREALIEAAASGTGPSQELRLHLDACHVCRADFAEERQLFVAIDTGLRANANAEVPTSFLPRVRARLEDAPEAERRWTPFLIFAAASAAIAVTLFIASRPRQATNDNQAKQALGVPFSETREKPASEEVVGSRNTAVAMSASRAPQRRNSNSVSSASSAGLEVIVPPDEREAFTRFVSARQERSEVAVAVVALAVGHEDASISVEPLMIAKLELTPLEQLESGAPDSAQEEQ